MTSLGDTGEVSLKWANSYFNNHIYLLCRSPVFAVVRPRISASVPSSGVSGPLLSFCFPCKNPFTCVWPPQDSREMGGDKERPRTRASHRKKIPQCIFTRFHRLSVFIPLIRVFRPRVNIFRSHWKEINLLLDVLYFCNTCPCRGLIQ